MSADICLQVLRLTPEHELTQKKRNRRLQRGDIINVFVWESDTGISDGDRRFFYSIKAKASERATSGLWAVWSGVDEYTLEEPVGNPRMAYQFCYNIVAGIENAKVQALTEALVDTSIIRNPHNPNYDPAQLPDRLMARRKWKLQFSDLPVPQRNDLISPPHTNSSSWTFMKSRIIRKLDHDVDGPSIEDIDVRVTGGRRRG